MISAALVLTVIGIYVGLLFGVAEWTERRSTRTRSPAQHPLIFALALGVYCTTWTYYGSVGKAATGGLLFIAIYLGPTLTVLVWWTIVRRLVRLKEVHRITSIADLVGARYGRSQGIAALATGIGVVGIAPYIALQLKATVAGFTLLTASDAGGAVAEGPVALLFAALLAVFAVAFGARRLDPTERHQGLVMALALECFVKLSAFLAVGLFVTYGHRDGFGDVFDLLATAPAAAPMREAATPYATWTAYLLLSMSAILFLPRQFHLIAVESSGARQLRAATWLLPLYLFLITLFAVPIAVCGLNAGLPIERADTYVLSLPLQLGRPRLALVVFVGGFSAAAGMVMASSVALATMVSNHLVLPLADRVPSLSGLRRNLLQVRWVTIAGIVLLGHVFERAFGDSLMLVSMGLLAFAAVFQLAPAILIGLFWRGGSRVGAFLGLGAGFATWGYTLLLPAFAHAGWVPAALVAHGPLGVAALRPEGLFGLTALEPLPHSVFWSLAFNLGAYFLGSLLWPGSDADRRNARAFVDVLSDEASAAVRYGGLEGAVDLAPKLRELEAVLGDYLRPAVASAAVAACASRLGLAEREQASIVELVELKTAAERVLAGAIGAAGAHHVFRRASLLSSKQRAELSKVYGRVLADLALSPDELREKVDYYREREALLTRHAGELSDRVAERDREIAERLRTEAELNRLAAAVEQAFEAVVIVGTDGSIHYVNPAFERITGYARGEVLGQPAGPLLGPDRRGLVEEILAEGRPREGTFTTSSREGRAVVIAGTVTPVRDEAGRIVDYVAVGRDVTEEQSLQERVRRVQKMDALGTLAGGIAHDFNNILQPILSFAQLVQATLPADHVASTHAGSVVAAALRARALVEQILAFARRSEQERHPVAIVAILKETLKFLRASLPATVELRMEIASDEVYVQADPTQLHQVVLNLVTNAAQAIGDSGGVVTVTLEPADAAPPALAASQPRLARGDVVRLAVADTGVGMDPETIERIFEPFFTTRGPGGGTGLGLAVAHGIVEAHGGALAVRSEPGRGSTFEVYLPTTEPAAPGADGGAVGAAVAAQRILVVDDEPAITEVERRILEEHGHRVVVAHDGSEALERFRADPDAFDVILSDQTMPGLRGVTLAEEVRRLRPGFPIVLCTGFDRTLDAQQVKALGLDGFLSKPFTAAELLRAIADAVGAPTDRR